jgi:serine/threonine protein kinase
MIMDSNEPNVNNTNIDFSNMEHYGNFIINPSIIVGTRCRRGIILSPPNVPPTVMLAIRKNIDEMNDRFTPQEMIVYSFLQSNPSPFIARMIDDHVIITDGQPSGRLIIMQAANGSNLHTVLRTIGRVPVPFACRMIVQITAAILHCHTHNIVLRDITIGHIFFADAQRRTAVLSDLSKSKFVQSNPAHPGKAFLTEKCGTPAYVAPELLTQQIYDGFAADIYSLGIVFFVAITRRFPFTVTTPDALYAQIVSGHTEWPTDLPIPVITLLRSMMDRNPITRITAHEILSLPWLVNLVAQEGINVEQIIAHQVQSESEEDTDMDEETDLDEEEYNIQAPINTTHELADKDPSVGN